MMYTERLLPAWFTTRASVAEVAMSWLLEVEGLVLDTLASTVLALDGVTGHLVSLCTGLGFLGAG